MTKIWNIKKENSLLQEELSKTLDISPVTAQLLVNRGIEDTAEAERFIKCKLSHLHDAWLFDDMRKAVARIKSAIDKREKILIYGDYDVDGITAAALLVWVLKDLGADVRYHLPNRLEDGYGLKIIPLDCRKSSERQSIFICSIC